MSTSIKLLLIAPWFVVGAASAQPPAPDVVWEQQVNALSVVYSADGAHVAAAGRIQQGTYYFGRIDVLAAVDGALVAHATSHPEVMLMGQANRLALSPDLQTVASAHGRGRCDPMTGCAPDRPRLLTWTFPDLQPLAGRADVPIVTGVDFSPDGGHLVAGFTYHVEGAVRTHDPATLEDVLVVQPHLLRSSDVTYSPDGTQIASVDNSGLLRVHDATTGEQLFTGHHGGLTTGGWPISVAYSPDGSRIATGGSGYHLRVKVWDASDGTLLMDLDGLMEPGAQGDVRVTYTPNGLYLAGALNQLPGGPGPWQGRIRFWDAQTGEVVEELTDTGPPPYHMGVQSVAFSPAANNRFAYSVGQVGLVKVAEIDLDLADGGVHFPDLPEVSRSSTRALAFDGQTSLVAGPSPAFPAEDDLSISLWADISGPGVLAELALDDAAAFRLDVVEADGALVLRYSHHDAAGNEVGRLFPQVGVGGGLRHIAVTRGGEPAAVRVYVDGRRVGQPFFYAHSPLASASRVLRLGQGADGSGGLTAVLDEVRLFSDRVPLDALRAAMHSTIDVTEVPPALVAYYRFEADTTGFAFDFSDSGSSGTLSGDTRVPSEFPIGEEGVLLHSASVPSGWVGPAGMRLKAETTSTFDGADALGLYVKNLSYEIVEEDGLPDAVLARSEVVWGAHGYGSVMADLTIEYDDLPRNGEAMVLLHRANPLAPWTDDTDNWVSGDDRFTRTAVPAFGEWAIGYGYFVGTDTGSTGLTEAIRLEAPFPNPARETTSLELTVRDAQDVRVDLVDVLGRRIAVLLDESLFALETRVLVVDTSRLPSGTYFIRAVAGSLTQARPILVVR